MARKTKQVEIVDPSTGSRTKVHEASFRNVWADRGWRIAADYDAEQEPEGAEEENADGGSDNGGDRGEQAQAPAVKAQAPKASIPPATPSVKPVDETGAGDSTQNP